MSVDVASVLMAATSRMRQVTNGVFNQMRHPSLTAPVGMDAVASELAKLRLQILSAIVSVPADTLREDTGLRLIEFGNSLMGAIIDQPLEKTEREILDVMRGMLAHPVTNPEVFRALLIVSLYDQPHKIPVLKGVEDLNDSRYGQALMILTRPSYFIDPDDEKLWLGTIRRLIAWLENQAKESATHHPRWTALRKSLLRKAIADRLDTSPAQHSDQPADDLVRERGCLFKSLVASIPYLAEPLPVSPPRPRWPDAPIRLGILTRNLVDYTDTRATFSHFVNFDSKRYQLYFYSLDRHDPNSEHRLNFYRLIYRTAHKTVSLSGTVRDKVRTILADDLDIFVVATAYSGLDMLLSHRLARLQLWLNSMIPMSMGHPSFDACITGDAPEWCLRKYRAECPEDVVTTPSPMVWYDPRPPTEPDEALTRATLGLPEDAVVFYNGHAAQKLVPTLLDSWMRILERVPGSILLLSPYNPSWDATFWSLTLAARLRAMFKRFPQIDPARVRLTGVLTPTMGNRIMLLGDVFLGSFPHGGSTSVMLSLLHATPLVVRQSPWLRGTTDANLTANIGLGEVVAQSTQEYVDIAARLGNDPAWRQSIRDTLKARQDKLDFPFFDGMRNSANMQTVFDRLIEDRILAATDSAVPNPAASSEVYTQFD
ncbi:MAG: hypothetical protein IPI58_00120 [Alphaproteobacteria bacterium]|nr:MAG: hypothetical protein IPI58_00120 [Alphaproteobacteria bacterium]